MSGFLVWFILVFHPTRSTNWDSGDQSLREVQAQASPQFGPLSRKIEEEMCGIRHLSPLSPTIV